MTSLSPNLFLEKFDANKHSNSIKTFNCGNKDCNNFIREAAAIYQKEDLGCTYVLLNEKQNVVAYVTVSMGALKFRDPDLALILNSEEKPNHLPALRIGRIGTILSEQNKGHGKTLIKIVISLYEELRQKLGARCLIVDSVPEKVEWYKKLGFKPLFNDTTGRSTIPMYLRP
ncbi:MAG: hypothetical protein Q8R15_02055 [Candidatus Micrarchaeota archaeon]|nr:hypothetical protein [Candidatus Micrarchaeota archaeon]